MGSASRARQRADLFPISELLMLYQINMYSKYIYFHPQSYTDVVLVVSGIFIHFSALALALSLA